MDVDFRKEQIKKLPRRKRRSASSSPTSTASTRFPKSRSSPPPVRAALGLSQKGHLGVGADADVASIMRSRTTTGSLFSYPRYVIKGGEVVVEEGEVRATCEGREFIVQPVLRRADRGVHPAVVPARSTRCRSRTTR